MYPILQGGGEHGIGLGPREFKMQFLRICKEHLVRGRAKAFAFIFCDLASGLTFDALHQHHGFNILNDASGSSMTVFYLHTYANERAAESFNAHFLRALGVSEQVQPPCIVCFRVEDENVIDVSFHAIDERTGDQVLVVEQMKRHIVAYLSEIGRQGDFSALSITKTLIPLLRLMRFYSH